MDRIRSLNPEIEIKVRVGEPMTDDTQARVRYLEALRTVGAVIFVPGVGAPNAKEKPMQRWIVEEVLPDRSRCHLSMLEMDWVNGKKVEVRAGGVSWFYPDNQHAYGMEADVVPLPIPRIPPKPLR